MDVKVRNFRDGKDPFYVYHTESASRQGYFQGCCKIKEHKKDLTSDTVCIIKNHQHISETNNECKTVLRYYSVCVHYFNAGIL